MTRLKYFKDGEFQDKAPEVDELHSHSNKTALDGITSTKVSEWDNKVETTDNRLSDARIPVAHNHTKANITDFSHSHLIADLPAYPTTLPANGGDANTAKHLIGDDTRSVNSNPSEYMSGGSRFVARAGWQTEFKNVSTVGLTGLLSGTYCYLQTHTPWSDPSGGYPIQVAYGNGIPCWRVGISITTWSAWQKVSDGGNASTVDGFTVGVSVPANAKFTDTNTIYVHPAGTNPHGATKTDVGLENVDNVKQFPSSGGVATGNIHILENPTAKIASLVTEVSGQLVDFGTNYTQSGHRKAGEHGALFRIDVRDGSPLFNIMFQDASGVPETTPFSVSREGKVNATNGFAKNGTEVSYDGHSHSELMPISGGTATGIMKAHNNTSYTVSQIRNTILSTSDAVLTSMADGDIWIKYV